MEQSDNQLQLERAEVLRVVDGDTVIVRLQGDKKRVRIIGIDTPESVSQNEEDNCEEGRIASAYTKELLDGKTVFLEFDKEREDQYGRMLAYVWLEEVENVDYETFTKKNAGALILQNTYCDTVYFPPNGKYRDWNEQVDR